MARATVTRLAPSPTGDPHVGTAYQALFDYVLSQKDKNGKFILRIEDTDRKRYSENSEKRIIQALDWLGLVWDAGPDTSESFRQSNRLPLYHRFAAELVSGGFAYYAFETPEELKLIKEESLAKTGLAYDGRAYELPKDKIKSLLESKIPHVIRLKVSNCTAAKKVIVKDCLRGEIEFDVSGIEDAVLIKSDGFPTYHFASVVDDITMEVSDVIRGEEWLPSFPIHWLIYEAFDAEKPNFYHLPLLQNKDRTKLSKRKGNTSIEHYEKIGILPEALVNYLASMAWSHPEGKEIYSIDEMIEKFDFSKVSTSGSIFDEQKLTWMSQQWIQLLDFSSLLRGLWEWSNRWRKDNELTDLEINRMYKNIKDGNELAELYLEKVFEIIKPRCKTFADMYEAIDYFLLHKSQDLTEDQQAVCVAFGAFLEENVQETWSAKDVELLIKEYVAANNLELKKFMPVIRFAITGKTVSPPMSEVIALMKEAAISILLNYGNGNSREMEIDVLEEMIRLHIQNWSKKSLILA